MHTPARFDGRNGTCQHFATKNKLQKSFLHSTKKLITMLFGIHLMSLACLLLNF